MGKNEKCVTTDTGENKDEGTWQDLPTHWLTYCQKNPLKQINERKKFMYMACMSVLTHLNLIYLLERSILDTR